MRSITRFSVAAAVCLCLFLPAKSVLAQFGGMKFGLGFQTLLATDDGLGFGFRTRLSAPVNADLSFALDVGASGFVLSGRDAATFVFDPQLSAIITLPGVEKAAYFLAGLGGYIPFDEKDAGKGGPTLHAGIGWVQPLRETTLFYEINPTLIIKRSKVGLAFPFRIGVIL